MRRLGRPRLSYANVTATLALAVALGTGGAYAAGRLAHNEVKSKNIAPKAVKASDIAKGAVKTAKIAPGAVTGAKVAADTITGANVAEATLGKVPDSDLLDGLDSSAFMRGSGETLGVFGFDKEDNQPTTVAMIDAGTITMECRNPASVGSLLGFTNGAGSPVDVWLDKIQDGFAPGTSITYFKVPNNGSATLEVPGPDVLSGTDILRFTIVAGNHLTLVEARLLYDGVAQGCHSPLLITELSG
jgi:hypothetical protein